MLSGVRCEESPPARAPEGSPPVGLTAVAAAGPPAGPPGGIPVGAASALPSPQGEEGGRPLSGLSGPLVRNMHNKKGNEDDDSLCGSLDSLFGTQKKKGKKSCPSSSGVLMTKAQKRAQKRKERKAQKRAEKKHKNKNKKRKNRNKKKRKKGGGEQETTDRLTVVQPENPETAHLKVLLYPSHTRAHVHTHTRVRACMFMHA